MWAVWWGGHVIIIVMIVIIIVVEPIIHLHLPNLTLQFVMTCHVNVFAVLVLIIITKKEGRHQVSRVCGLGLMNESHDNIILLWLLCELGHREG